MRFLKNSRIENDEWASNVNNVEIIYEDDCVLVINKSVGMGTHPDGKTDMPTVSEWFLEKYSDAKDVGENIVTSNGTEIEKPGIVHRLDRDTSGVMILAKDQESFLFLKEQFQERKVEKEYRAFVYGNVQAPSTSSGQATGIIDRPIGRSAQDFRLRSAQRGARGKMREAVTHYEVISRSEETSYLKLMPKTGRTHQLRVHLKAINHPIVCDNLYAPKRECALGFKRLALHAFSLSIEIPEKGRQTFEAPLPSDFSSAKDKLF